MNILTYLDFELIKLLYKENTLSQRAISKRLNCSLGKTNETIKNLKELEYINDDNSLTDLGIDLIKKNKSAVILAAGQGIRMIPINMVSCAIAGAIAGALGVYDNAAWGGLVVLPVTSIATYFLCTVIGVAIYVALCAIFKKDYVEKEEK